VAAGIAAGRVIVSTALIVESSEIAFLNLYSLDL